MQGDADPASFWRMFSLAVRFAAYAWAAGECFFYWSRLRRRARFGFGDPLVANRMLLWGLGTTAIAAVWIRSMVLAVGSPESVETVGQRRDDDARRRLRRLLLARLLPARALAALGRGRLSCLSSCPRVLCGLSRLG